MATQFVNFSTYTTGQTADSATPTAVTGWTGHSFGGNWNAVITDLGGGVKVLRIDANGSSDDVFLMTLDALDGTNGASAALEVVAKVNLRSAETGNSWSNGQLRTVCVLTNAPTNLVAYCAGKAADTTQFSVVELASGGTIGTTHGTAAYNGRFTGAMDTLYWIRLRRETDGVLKARIWRDGDSEPGTWDITTSADTTLTSGKMGFGHSIRNAVHDYYCIGFATGGETAPTSSVAAITGTGAISAPVPTVAGSGSVNSAAVAVDGSGAIAASKPTMAGSGTRGVRDLGTPVDLIGIVPVVAGEGTVTPYEPPIVGDPYTGTGAITASVPTVAGAGVIGHSGTGAVAAPVPTIDAPGYINGIPTVTSKRRGWRRGVRGTFFGPRG